MLLTERIAMRDGCGLATDIYLPGEGVFPVLLAMTPYGRKGLRALAGPVCAAGYALVLQDVRGRYDSEGKFNPIAQEKADGPDTVAWLREQGWFDQTAGIGIIGISYLSEVGLALAARCPEVRAMINVGGMADFYDISHRGGALMIHHALPWTIITSHSPQPSLQGPNWLDVYATWPLTDAAAAAGFPNDIWQDWSRHDCRDDYWHGFSVRDDLQEVDIPILHLSGWYDICLGSTINLYSHFQRASACPQRLVLGPWSHNGVISGNTRLADVQFGASAQSEAIPRMLAWFDRFLKGNQAARIDQSAVTLFLTGEQSWLRSEHWPIGGSQPTSLYLSTDNRMSWQAGDPGQVMFRHDPLAPVPTIGGGVWEFPAAGLEPGPTDQSALLDRDDVSCFQTDTLPSSVTMVGPVVCSLFAEIDQETADFVVRLLDVSPQGERRWVADGILRAHFRLGEQAVVPVVPAAVEEYRVDLWAVGHTFLAGHRLAVEVSGSSFPKWSVNRGRLNGTPHPVEQTVHFGLDYPSALHCHLLVR